MSFFHRVFAALSENDGKSRRSMWPPVLFLVFCIFFFGYRAANESDAASRQQTSSGIIGQCEQRGRGHQNYCDYTFSVGDEQYTGDNQAADGLELGQTVMVYYDGRDPTANALEDFAEQSRESRRLVYIFLLVLVAVVAFVLWDRAPYPETSNKLAP